MRRKRIDLSRWLIHFVHARNPENEPGNVAGREVGGNFPFHVNDQKNARFDCWHARDAQYGLEADATPDAVLCKILHDGHIRAGWSFRGGRATIYGPRPAVCFTEMPLHALLNYAARRRDAKNVTVYGVCLPKHEVFAAGARPVIYGLTGKHKEITRRATWPRILAAECGIAEHEQYRYVAMNLRARVPVDWSHEREWRWCDANDGMLVPGLPIWLAGLPHHFSQALILVNTSDEAEGFLNKIKQLHDAGRSDFGDEYDRELLRNTGVIAIEEVVKAVGPERVGTIRIEEIPPARRAKVARPTPTDELIAKVKSTIARAKAAAEAAAQQYCIEARKTYNTFFVGPRGYASVMVFHPQSGLTEALLQLGAVSVYAGGGYSINDLTRLGCFSLLEAETAAYAAVNLLEAEFPESVFWVRTEPG
jgi:hypothetical protein